MAGADVIGTAICIGLLIIVAYVVAGSILTTTGVVINTQNDMNKQNAARLNTAIQISDVYFSGPYLQGYLLHFHITNIGTEAIGDFNSMDVFVTYPDSAPVHYIFDANSFTYWGDSYGCGDADMGTWNYGEIVPENIHPAMLDPGELISVRIIGFDTKPDYYQVGAATSDGVSAFYTV